MTCQAAADESMKRKVVFIMGATGTGKTKLSIALATRLSGEIINSDKIQAYKGLDIISNKLPEPERLGVPHHLIGFLDPEEDFPAEEFCRHALTAIDKITQKGNLPIIVGGSNTYIEALVEDPDFKFKANFDCCFLWMDVEVPVLYGHIERRVDEMVDAGLVEEVRGFFCDEADYTRGVRRAIGAPELHSYFQVKKDVEDHTTTDEPLLNAAIKEIKKNTRKLVDRQLEKIQRLRTELGWKMHRIEATNVIEKRGKDAEDAWEKLVLKPSLGIVNDFLKEVKF